MRQIQFNIYTKIIIYIEDLILGTLKIDQREKEEKLMNIRMILTMCKNPFFHNEVL